MGDEAPEVIAHWAALLCGEGPPSPHGGDRGHYRSSVWPADCDRSVSMRTKRAFLPAVALLLLTGVSTTGETRLERGTRGPNPITIESQIREIQVEGDDVIIHLYRQPYDIVAVKWLPVETLDGQRLYARDLIERDNIHLEGDLNRKVVYANRIVLQRREQHIGGDSH